MSSNHLHLNKIVNSVIFPCLPGFLFKADAFKCCKPMCSLYKTQINYWLASCVETWMYKQHISATFIFSIFMSRFIGVIVCSYYK